MSWGKWQPVGGQTNLYNINGLGFPTAPNAPFESIGENGVLTNRLAPKENPRSAATDAGATLEAANFKTQEYRERFDAARALISAIRDCHPEESVLVMEAALEALRQGKPMAAFRGLMFEAENWAALASRAELKCYAVATFNAMCPTDQRAFLGHVQGRAAA